MSRQDSDQVFCLSCGEAVRLCQCSNTSDSWEKLEERAKYKKAEKQRNKRTRLRKKAKQQLHKAYSPRTPNPQSFHQAIADRLGVPRSTDRETLLLLFNEYLQDLKTLRAIRKINQRDTEGVFATNATQISSDDPDHVGPATLDLDALPEAS